MQNSLAYTNSFIIYFILNYGTYKYYDTYITKWPNLLISMLGQWWGPGPSAPPSINLAQHNIITSLLQFELS